MENGIFGGEIHKQTGVANRSKPEWQDTYVMSKIYLSGHFKRCR